jgi:hypothetical protein
VCAALAAAAALLGTAAALHYARLDLTLSHYDARGHLVVARRIIDSITPGWQQIGAVWLPLPHLLNAVPVQADAFYRTGASGVAISIASFAAATAAIGWIVLRVTRSAGAALVGAAVFALNPNVLYLQATPMTEPLLLGLLTVAIARLTAWTGPRSARSPDPGRGPGIHTTGILFALACLTRYEAWPVTLGALALAALARLREGARSAAPLDGVIRMAIYPAGAVLGFLLFSRIVVGEWFVSSGFFVPEERLQGRPIGAAVAIWWGTHQLSGYALAALSSAGLAWLALRSLRRGAAWTAVPLALVATAALPWLAFLDGHPFRIRYMVPLIVAEAIGAGVAAAFFPRARAAATILVAALVLVELQPFDRAAPMVAEAQWDRPNASGRQSVTDCLRQQYGGDTVMASMGSLGHYMQELGRAGFDLRDFLHEGNGDIWLAALVSPGPFVGWILVEEQAEGGDMLATRARENPRFLDGFSRVCEGGGVALYRRHRGHAVKRNDTASASMNRQVVRGATPD